MSNDELTESERIVVGECLRASCDGPFFEDWEFTTLFGLERHEVRKIADEWPNVDLTDSNVSLAITNSLTNLIGYPHSFHTSWEKYISASLEDLKRLSFKLNP